MKKMDRFWSIWVEDKNFVFVTAGAIVAGVGVLAMMMVFKPILLLIPTTTFAYVFFRIAALSIKSAWEKAGVTAKSKPENELLRPIE